MRSLLLLLLLPLLSVLPLLVPSEGASEGNKFSECKVTSYTCGVGFMWSTISYPFRLPGMPEYCGLPGYDVTCKGDSTSDAMLVLEIDGTEYKVGRIDYEAQIINLVNTAYLQGEPCSRIFHNTTFDPSRFSYVAYDLNLTVHYGCSPRVTSSRRWDGHKIPCPPGSDRYNNSYYSLPGDDDDYVSELLRSCNSTTLIPILDYELYKMRAGTVRPEGILGAIQSGFYLNWTSDGTGWCKGCEDAGGICGSDLQSPGKPGRCACDDGSVAADGTCTTNGAKRVKRIITASAAGAGFLVVCLSLVLYLYKYRKALNSVFWRRNLNLNNGQKIETFLEEHGSVTPKRYSYSHVKKMTKAFGEKLGQGGFGTVFKGTLDNGHMVAVKILNDSKGDGEEFINEVASIGGTSHVNVVSLLGFCYERSKRALIYDFMCNGSLDKLLCLEVPKTTFDWEKLYRIALGVARGLEYLHRGCNTRIVHFDIKPHNILLDRDFCPKISDFGLAKLCLHKESIISIAGARGTIGYIAPEVFSRNFGVVSSKSDVYSYGMMVLEIAGGRKNPNEGVEDGSEKYFPHWIYTQLDQNGDLSTCGIPAESEEIVRKMVLVGLWCIQTIPENRPSMGRVIEMMESHVNDLQIPPKPHLYSAPLGPIIVTSSIQDICLTDCSSQAHSSLPQV